MEGSKDKAAILLAAEGGDKKVLQQAIAEQIVGVVDDDGNTPLMYAATNGREEILRMLLDRECICSNKLDLEAGGKEGCGSRYIDVQNRYGWTALMQAACYGHAGSVALLLQRGADLTLHNVWKASCLVLASQGGHFGVVNSLISHGAKVDVSDLMSCTLTPLMAAAQCGHAEVVQELLRGGAQLEVQLKATRWTALMFAVLNNQVGAVEQLVLAGADKEVQDIGGKTPADLASSLGHHGVVTLLSGGTLKNVSDSEFFEAVSKGNVSKVTEVLTQQPNMASIEDKDGATPLMFASNKGHSQVCEVLLEAKAEVNTKDRKYGWTALMHATHNRRYDVAEKLGQSGADVNVRDNNGSTAYDIASVIGDIRMIKLIANITVQRLQDKATATPTATPTASTPSIATSNSAINDSSAKATPTKATPTKARPINLGELRSRLQNAYRTPIPKITVPDDSDNPGSLRSPSTQSPGAPRFLPGQSPGAPKFPSAQSPGAPRFPPAQSPGTPRFLSGRVPRPLSSSSSSSPSAQPSLAPKPLPSPSKSAGSFPANKLPTKPTQRPAISPSPFITPPSTRGVRARDITPPSTRGVGARDITPPSTRGVRARDITPPEQRKAAAGGAQAHRKRANTDSAVPRMHQRKGHVGDLKSVLLQSSMERYWPMFEEQEVDYESFLSLCSDDLLELGITDPKDRGDLMTLIREQPRGYSSFSMDSEPVFHYM